MCYTFMCGEGETRGHCNILICSGYLYADKEKSRVGESTVNFISNRGISILTILLSHILCLRIIIQSSIYQDGEIIFPLNIFTSPSLQSHMCIYVWQQVGRLLKDYNFVNFILQTSSSTKSKYCAIGAI